MDRRAFIAGVAGTAILLPGCAAAPGANPAGDANGVDDGANDPDETEENGLDDEIVDERPFDPSDEPTVVDFETASLSASVVGGTFTTTDHLYCAIDFLEPATADSPATLVAWMQNRNSFDQTFRGSRVVLFDNPPAGRREGFHERITIYLAPTDATAVAEYVPPVYADPDGRWRIESVRQDWFPETITLGVEGELSAEFFLLGHPDKLEPPIVPGTYRFAWRDNEFAIAIWPTDEPGPTAASRFVDEEVSAVPGIPAQRLPFVPERDGTAWYHEASTETETYLRPSVEVIEAPGKIEFELVNRARTSAIGNPFYWRVYKYIEDEWLPVAPWSWPAPASSVGPGGVDESTLHCYHGEPINVPDVRTIGHLGGGRYAYAVGYSVTGADHAAMFDLDAPDLSVDPEEDVLVEDEGDQVVVTLSNHEGARKPATFTVSRTANADERIIDEQLIRYPFRGFRNALPFFAAGVDSVRVLTDRSTALRPVSFEDGGTRAVEYDGEAFDAIGAIQE